MTNESSFSQEDEDINEQMVRQMEQRRHARPERRQRAGAPNTDERRRTCSFCYQSGDHRTPTQCLRALER